MDNKYPKQIWLVKDINWSAQDPTFYPDVTYWSDKPLNKESVKYYREDLVLEMHKALKTIYRKLAYPIPDDGTATKLREQLKPLIWRKED